MHRRSRNTPLLGVAATCALLYWFVFRQPSHSAPSLEDSAFYRATLQKQSGAAFRSEFPYSSTLVVPTTSEEDLSWMQEQITDLLYPEGNYSLTLYVVDDPSAHFHVSDNKGREAMAYLTYMIDFYDNFPEISVFLHGKENEWHNNNLLNDSTSLMLHNLNLDKVARDGYVNLRCQWDPGCPDQIHPHNTEWDSDKNEQVYFHQAWQELFLTEDVPEVLAQPCCSQFAVTRDRLQYVSKDVYVHLRDWLLNTTIPDHESGRVFEYTWQYLFNERSAVFCPDPRVCYCELYGICFPTSDGYDEYFQLRQSLRCSEEDLKEWYAQWELHTAYEKGSLAGMPVDHSQKPRLPEHGLDKKLISTCEKIKGEMAERQQAARDHGRNSSMRAAALDRGWKAMKSPPRDSPECKRQ